MTISIIIFAVSLIVVFGILVRSARQIQSGKRQLQADFTPDISFRKIEKYVLYYTKDIVQVTVVTVVKYSMITALKTKKILKDKWPKIHNSVKKVFKKREAGEKPSFIQKAILESKTKIRRIKDKVKKDHGEKLDI